MPIWHRGLLTSQHSSLAKEVHVCLHSFNRTIACGAPSIKPCGRPELLAPWRACLRSEAGPSPGVPGSVGQEGGPEHALSTGSQVRPMLLVWSPTIRRPGPGIFPLPRPSTSASSTLAGTFLGSTKACLSLLDDHPCSAVSPTKF